MRMFRQTFTLITGLLVLAFILGNVTMASADPAVTLTVLNTPNEFGDVIIVRGDSVEVEFNIIDPLKESRPRDVIRLIRIKDGAVASQTRKGKGLSGSRSMGTQQINDNKILGELRVEYVSYATRQVIATAEQTVFLVANQAVLELTRRTAAVEEEAQIAKEKAEIAEIKAEEAITKAIVAEMKAQEAETKADAADAKAEVAKTKADTADAKAVVLKERADATDTEIATARLEREAAMTERQANEQAARDAKTKADTADAKAEVAKTKADTADGKAVVLKERADATDTEIATARQEREAAMTERQANEQAALNAKTKADAADAKAATAQTKAEEADAKAEVADTKATNAQAKADTADAKAGLLKEKDSEIDAEITTARLERQAAAMERLAAQLERQANASVAQEAKTAADTAYVNAAAADSKATSAETKADAADTKATIAQATADTADTKADAADTKATIAQATADTALATSVAAQSCPADQFVTGFDAGGNIICAAMPGAPAMSLLAYYSFDGHTNDTTGNGYDGTVGGTEMYDVGRTGDAFFFDGSTYISTSLDIDVSVQPQLTMGAWVRPDGGTFYGQVMTHDDQGFDRSLIHYGSDWRAYDGGSGGSVHTGPLSASDSWQFVAVVYDQSRQTVMLFVNGTAVTKAGQVLGASVNMFHFGYNPSNNAEFFRGLVDEAFVVSGALSFTELRQIWLNGFRSVFP